MEAMGLIRRWKIPRNKLARWDDILSQTSWVHRHACMSCPDEYTCTHVMAWWVSLACMSWPDESHMHAYHGLNSVHACMSWPDECTCMHCHSLMFRWLLLALQLVYFGKCQVLSLANQLGALQVTLAMHLSTVMLSVHVMLQFVMGSLAMSPTRRLSLSWLKSFSAASTVHVYT